MQSCVIPGLNVQIHYHLGITSGVPATGGGVEGILSHRLGRRIFQLLQGAVLHGRWLILG